MPVDYQRFLIIQTDQNPHLKIISYRADFVQINHGGLTDPHKTEPGKTFFDFLKAQIRLINLFFQTGKSFPVYGFKIQDLHERQKYLLTLLFSGNPPPRILDKFGNKANIAGHEAAVYFGKILFQRRIFMEDLLCVSKRYMFQNGGKYGKKKR